MHFTGQPVIDRSIRNYGKHCAYRIQEIRPDLRADMRREARSIAQSAKWMGNALAVIAVYREHLVYLDSYIRPKTIRMLKDEGYVEDEKGYWSNP